MGAQHFNFASAFSQNWDLPYFAFWVTNFRQKFLFSETLEFWRVRMGRLSSCQYATTDLSTSNELSVERLSRFRRRRRRRTRSCVDSCAEPSSTCDVSSSAASAALSAPPAPVPVWSASPCGIRRDDAPRNAPRGLPNTTHRHRSG